MTTKKKIFSSKEKADILKSYLLDKAQISEICKKNDITENTLLQWERKLCENCELVFKNLPDDGMEYYHNYDFVINYLSDAFRGHTLEVLGIKSAPIRRVSSFKVADISVKAGIIDIVFEDVNGKSLHLEEQRNMTIDDFYRFGGQHFFVAKEYTDNIEDIILISGKKYGGKREIQTLSGTYSPTFVDLTKRNGPEQFKKIQEAIKRQDYSSLLELVFVPLYGREDKQVQSKFAEKVVRFELDLCKQNKMDKQLLAATLIMCNKILDKEIMNNIWEEVKMINILKFAHDKGREEGKKEEKKLGLKEGCDMLMDVLYVACGVVPGKIAEMLRSITNWDVLKGLLKEAVKCENIDQFERILVRVVEQEKKSALQM